MKLTYGVNPDRRKYPPAHNPTAIPSIFNRSFDPGMITEYLAYQADVLLLRVYMAKKPKTTRPYQVFLSHATADKWLATKICEKIEATGASTFRDDRDIDGGDDIPEQIRTEIKRSHEIVVLLTPNSVNRQWVLLEVGAAWGWKRFMRITPIMCHVDVDPIPGMIKSKKAIHINDCSVLFSEIEYRVRKHHDKKKKHHLRRVRIASACRCRNCTASS